MKTHWQKTVPAVALAALMMVGLAGTEARAAGDSVDLTFKYTVLQGTCAVSVGDDGLNGVLKFGDIVTSDTSWNAWAPMKLASGASAKLPFIVKLTGCSGVAGTAKPALTLQGDTDTYTNNTTNAGFMFVNASSVAKGVGFAIYTIGGTATSDLVADIKSSQPDARKYIYLTNITGGVAADQDITLNAIVTCGATCTATDKLKMRAGALTARVTFNFVYH